MGYTIWAAKRRFSSAAEMKDFCAETVERLAHKGGPDGFDTIVEYTRDEKGILLRSISDWDSGVVEQVEFAGEAVKLSHLVWNGLPE